MTAPAKFPNFKRRKIGDRVYEITRRDTGEVVGHAAMTGEYGRDDYPWDAHGLGSTDGVGIGQSYDSLTSFLYALDDRVSEDAARAAVVKAEGK